MAKRHGLGDLRGRTVVITGAAHGLGRAVATQLWSKGVHLALLDKDGEALAALVAVLRAGAAGEAQRCSAHVVDVGQAAEMARAADEVEGAHGAVHGLVNNAGVGHEAPLQRVSLSTWRRVVDVNFWGVVHGVHFFLPLLARADRAQIVNLSSLFGFTGMAGQAPYCATKYAVRGLSESLWEELRDTSVGVTVVHPGSLATDIMARADGDDPALMRHIVDWYRAHAYPTEKAAAQVVRALERGTPRLLITAEAFVVDLVKRLAPVWGNRLVCALILRVLRLTHMRAQRRALWEAPWPARWSEQDAATTPTPASERVAPEPAR